MTRTASLDAGFSSMTKLTHGVSGSDVSELCHMSDACIMDAYF